jgi:hypothetical protein
MSEALDAALRFKELVAARGCPPDLSMEQMVRQGYATMAEVLDLKKVVEAELPEYREGE